jgi:phosphatidylserine/phosphatidylglycerophosphate/cardiolipin synthase-like enzyme
VLVWAGRRKEANKVIDFLTYNGVIVRFDHKSRQLHHKFMIIDDKCVQTGSFNYSANAANVNAENVIVICYL